MKIVNNRLTKVKDLNQKIITLKEKLTAIDDSLEKITTEINGLPKSQNYESRIERLTLAKIALEQRIASLQGELVNEKAVLVSDIFAASNLSNTEMKILLNRYVALESFDTIASQLFLSQSRVFALHRIATNKFLSAG